MTIDYEAEVIEQAEKRNKVDLIYIIAIAGPFMTLPQIYQIFTTKSVSGVSLLTWVSYLLMATCWIFYGIKQKDKPIIVNNILWAIFEILVITGILLYN
jgi:uncharacterized protein with PQ loop repeat